MNLIGKIIGNRYEILEEVGNGGMATVYKAKDHVLNRYVAVKVLKDEYTTDSDFIKRFNTEAQSAASLSHANIVSIYDVGHEEENNLYYIVMELVKGKTLKEIIKKDGTLSWKWAVNIAIQIASALEVAHKNGIIHRDIKPHNIIITEDGVAKVTDFGIAKAVSNSTMTAFGTTIGSVHYFSPEQAKGGITDAKSDLYSLGVVMYEMLTGKVPFDADTPVSIALKHMQEEAIEPIEINPEIPTAVNQIVIKAMKNTNIDIVFIGGPDHNNESYYKECIKLAEDCDNIHFLGWQTDKKLIASAYGNADTFVLPSFHETFGLVLLEAGVSGAKLAISNTLPILEFDSFNTYNTFDPNSSEKIREAIMKTYNSEKDTVLKDKILQQFSWTNVIKLHLDLYSQL